MRPVAVISHAEIREPRTQLNDAELVMPVVTEALAKAKLDRHAVGFTISGSSDFLTGTPFSFVAALDAVGAWPPIQESHVEMDGAWALYEAWVRLQHGDIDTALVFAFGRSSLGDLDDVLCMQLDPYYVAPLWPDPSSLAGLQARALSVRLEREIDVASCKQFDGAAAIVLAAGDRATQMAKRPAWIKSIDHRIEPHSLGARDLTRSQSTKLAAKNLQVSRIERAELHARFAHEEIILKEALSLSDKTKVRSDGAPLMVCGLSRIGEAAKAILDGECSSTLAHATSGPCLQQNLVCWMEAQP
jgi:hypothetical protein